MVRLKKLKFNNTSYEFPVEDVKVGTTSVVTNGVATIDLSDINTKTFYLSGTSDLTTAQAAYDWYAAGKNPVIIYNSKSYQLYKVSTSSLSFYTSIDKADTNDGISYIKTITLVFYISSGNVTAISSTYDNVIKLLRTDYNYPTPYTPTYDGSPATKKYVDDRDTYIGSSEPTSNKVEGRLWYDTTNDQLKVYDGTNWNVTGKEYNAGEGIEIKNGADYSAMQGPAPSGFHVPTDTEWTAVKTVWTTLGGGSSDGTNFGIALKLPFTGNRYYSSADVINQGSYGYYWSSSRNGTSSAYYLYFGSSAIKPQNAYYRAYGFSVRCFKNSPVVPMSSWTKLYGTSIESGGIFWSSTDGLISLSSDGTTWITISDKNLGATTVRNSGDTLSEANCGKYYQRGNNYGFPRTGTIANQSTTQVDASSYGPGNYYSSDTFIKYSGRWDSTDNGNLWGGVTGVVTFDNAIINTGVLSVNGQTGDVTTATVMTASEYSQVSNPVAGKIYFIKQS